MNVIIQRLRADARSLLTSDSVLALDAFLAGYRVANENSGAVFARLDSQFAGPDSFNACMRAYLAIGDEKAAMDAVLDALERLQVTPAIGGQRDVSSILPTFVDFVRDHIVTGRSGLVLAEPTVLWLADYARGYIAGIASMNPAAAKAQQQQLQAFEAWLRDKYESGPHTPWYGLVRIYKGMDIEGLRGFVRLWDQFIASTKSDA